jgi:dienelactone hydrolase
MHELRWVGQPHTEGGVTERRFELEWDGRPVPGIVWLPGRAGRPRPVVLMGHGGSGHKRSERQLRLGRWFAGAQLAAVAIDGPYHGDRVPAPMQALRYQQRMAAVGVDRVTDGMVLDWRATLDALGQAGAVDADRAAYLGLSMGTRFGLPYVAVSGDRLRCAVLGKYGMRQPASMPAGADMAPRFRRDAPRVTAPVLFHLQWDDEVFARDGQLELFDLLGSDDKRLLAFPGPHSGTSPAALQSWRGYIADHLQAA